MRVEPPPYPEYREQPTVVTREYRVVFWQHQLPPEGSDIPPDQMGWEELTVDLSEVEDAHEAIAWAEDNIDTQLDEVSIAWAERFGDEFRNAPHGERIYVLTRRCLTKTPSSKSQAGTPLSRPIREWSRVPERS